MREYKTGEWFVDQHEPGDEQGASQEVRPNRNQRRQIDQLYLCELCEARRVAYDPTDAATGDKIASNANEVLHSCYADCG